MVLYMPLDHCHPAEGSNFHLGTDKIRQEKDGDICKIVKILFNESKDSGKLSSDHLLYLGQYKIAIIVLNIVPYMANILF
jgi:hypothetical protein